jgi:hypothetical protein
MGIGIQVTTLVFLPAAAPADIVAAQAFLLVGLFLIIEKAFKNFHLTLHPILLASLDRDRHSAIRIPNCAIELIPAASASATPAASETAPAAFPPGSSAFGIPLGTGFIDRDGVSQELSAVEPLNGLFRRFLGLHFHEPKAPGKSRKFILDDVYGYDFSHFGKVRFQILFGYFGRQVPNIEVLIHVVFLSFLICPSRKGGAKSAEALFGNLPGSEPRGQK